MPTKGMREAAERYRQLEKRRQKRWRYRSSSVEEQHRYLSGNELSPDVVVQMAAWFARHAVDKKAEGF